jgi:hypothetical protein
MPSTIFRDVALQLISAESTCDYTADIRADDAVMVINIHEDQGPYLIRGTRVGHFYAGVDEADEVVSVDLVARWCQLGDIWVGYWCEDGEECLFSFRLPKSATASRKAAKRRS